MPAPAGSIRFLHLLGRLLRLALPGLVPLLYDRGSKQDKDHGRNDVGSGSDRKHVLPLVHGAPLGSEVCHQHGRDEAACRSDKIDDSIQCAGEVRRQVLGVLQIGHGGGAVETQREGYDGHANVRIEPGVDEPHEEQSGDYVSCN